MTVNEQPHATSTLILRGALTTADASALLDEVRARAAAGPVTIDAAEVSYIGAAPLQVLAALARSPSGLSFAARSAAFEDCVRLAGLTSMLAMKESPCPEPR